MRFTPLAVSLFLVASQLHAAGAVRAITAAGAARWAVGDGGLVLRSDDGGQSWKPVAIGGAGDFTGVHFAGERVGHVFGGRCVAGHPGGATVGVIARTEDAGRTWKPVNTGSLAHLHGGWMRGQRGVVFGRPTPRHPTGLWATVTAGRMWIPLRLGGTGSLLGGDSLGASNACLVGPNHRIVHLHKLDQLTTGEAPLASGAALTAVAFAGLQSIWAVGENGSALRYTGPAVGWQTLPLSLPVGTRRLADLEAVAAGADGEAFLAGGLAGSIFHTRDGGKTFQRLRAPGPGPIHALHRDADGVLLAGGDGGRIFRSTDAGKTWRRVHGAESVDVLFVTAPGDVSFLAALAIHAASGVNTAVLVATLPEGNEGLRDDVALRSAAVAAGADGAHVLTDFHSVAGDPAAVTLAADDILSRWSARLDSPARREMLRQIAAAIRLYRPVVVVLGPDGYEGRGPAAENRLVSRIAAEAVKQAGDADAYPELARLGLAPWKVKRVFTGLDHNARYVPPWEKVAPPPRENLTAEFAGWWYPVKARTSAAMLAAGAGWRLRWAGLMDRPAMMTGFRCREVLAPRKRLFTAGLKEKGIRLQSSPPVSHAVASGALLRAAGLVGGNAAIVAGPLAAAARKHPDDPVPADMLHLLRARLMGLGRLVEAADVNRALLSVGRSHPLYERVNITSVAMAASSEWRARLVRIRPGSADPAAANAPRFEDVLKRLEGPPWWPWVADEHGTMLMGKAHAFVGERKAARQAYTQLAKFARTEPWRAAARVELAALQGPAHALAAGEGMTAFPADAPLRLDGLTAERFWKRARPIELMGPAGGASVRASARLAAVKRGLAVAIRIKPDEAGDNEPTEAVDWSLQLAVDADRDAWTQLVLTCDSTGAKRVELLTRLAPSATVSRKLFGLQAQPLGSGWSIEVLVPHAAMGEAGREGLVRTQLQLRIGEGPDASVFHLHPQADDRLLPHRYALVALPAPPTARTAISNVEH